MDEPFGAVDPIVRAQLQREFARLQRELGKTVVFVTHDVDEAFLLGDRVAVLGNGGRLAQLAGPAELLSAPASTFVSDFVGDRELDVDADGSSRRAIRSTPDSCGRSRSRCRDRAMAGIAAVVERPPVGRATGT